MYGPSRKGAGRSLADVEIQRLIKNKVSLFGFLLVILALLTALFAPLIAPHDP